MWFAYECFFRTSHGSDSGSIFWMNICILLCFAWTMEPSGEFYCIWTVVTTSIHVFEGMGTFVFYTFLINNYYIGIYIYHQAFIQALIFAIFGFCYCALLLYTVAENCDILCISFFEQDALNDWYKHTTKFCTRVNMASYWHVAACIPTSKWLITLRLGWHCDWPMVDVKNIINV